MGEFWTRFSGNVAEVWSLSESGAVSILSALLIGLFINLLSDEGSYQQIAAWVSSPRRLYLNLMWGAQERLDQFFGPPASGKAIDRCLALAFFYPAFALFVAWILGGTPTLAGIPIFVSGTPVWLRIAILIVFLGWMGACYAIIQRHIALAEIMRRALPRRMRSHSVLVYLSEFLVLSGPVAVVGAVAFVSVSVGVGAVAFLLLVIGAGAVIGVGVGAVAGAGAGVGAGVGAVVGAVVVAGAVAVAVAVAGTGAGAGAVTMLTLYGALPLLNALFDWASWWISRRLLRHLVGSPPQDRTVPDYDPRLRIGLRKLLGHTAADLFAAIFFLIALAVVLPVLFQFGNLALTRFGLPPVEWWSYLAAARRDPFGEGFLVTAMLLTTLLPTAAHFLALAFSLLLPLPTLWGRSGQQLLDWLTDPAPSLTIRLKAGFWLLGTVLGSWLAVLLAVLALEAAVWSWGLPVGTCLADAAQFAGLRAGTALPGNALAELPPITCSLLE